MILLGSTGSIGENALLVASRLGIKVDVLVAGTRIARLNEQIKIYAPSYVVVAHAKDIPLVNHHKVLAGEAAILEVIEASASALVVNALVGFLGLKPTLKAIACGKKVALANKESLVAAGAFVDTSAIQPIDSEHFGLWYLLQNRPHRRMVITASGGAFRDWPLEKLTHATLADTQKHPNWSMGQKITIDSATMANKLFELLEARWLFGAGTYDAVIETKSLMHALIDFHDGSSTAHFAHANMQLPIAYAIDPCHKERLLENVDLVHIASLEFREISPARYPIWSLKDALLQAPQKGVIVNAANEAAIARFIAGTGTYLDISRWIIKAFQAFDTTPTSIEAVFDLDAQVRAFVQEQ